MKRILYLLLLLWSVQSVQAAPLFKFERGSITFGAASRTSPNIDLSQSLGSDAGFCILPNTKFSGVTPTSNTTGVEFSDDMGASITYVDNDTIQLTKAAGADLEDSVFRYLCITYVGPSGGVYEWKIRFRGTIQYSADASTAHQAVGSIANFAKFFPVLAAVRADNTATHIYDQALSTVESTTSPSDGILITRGDPVGTATISVVGIELTGSAWDLRKDIAITFGDGAAQQNDFTAVTDLDANCILWTSFRSNDNEMADISYAIYPKAGDNDSLFGWMDAASTNIGSMAGIAVAQCGDDVTTQYLRSFDSGAGSSFGTSGNDLSIPINAVTSLDTSFALLQSVTDNAAADTPSSYINYWLSAVDTLTGFRSKVGSTEPWALMVAEMPEGAAESDPTITATVEICGSGIDENSGESQPCPEGYVSALVGSGCDLLCDGVTDQDRDGVEAALDCDDTNPLIFDGYERECGSSGWQVCSGGEWSDCSETTRCGASGSGTCYYVDPVDGDDAAVGSFAAPKKSLRCFGWDNGCVNPISLEAGDVVYAMAGTIDQTYTSGSTRSVYIRADVGTSSDPIKIRPYPGDWWEVTIDPGCDSGTPCWPVELASNQYLHFEGFKITGGYTGGLRVTDGVQNVIRRNLVYDNRGVENNNMNGIEMLAPDGGVVSHNFLYDNYDVADDGPNNMQIAVFQGDGLQIGYNRIWFSDSAQAAVTNASGIRWKHSGALNSDAELVGNIIVQSGLQGIESAQSGAHIHGNIIVDGTRGIRVADLGGAFRPDDVLIEHNSLINTRGFSFGFAGPDSTGPVELSDNVVLDDQAANYNTDAVLVDVDHYGSSSDYGVFITGGLLTITGNCYYNATQDFDGSIFGWAGAASGASYTDFASWQAAGWDVLGAWEDPELDANNEATSTNCVGKGAVLSSSSSPSTPSSTALDRKGLQLGKMSDW